MTKFFLTLLVPAMMGMERASAAGSMELRKEMEAIHQVAPADTAILLKKAQLPKDTAVRTNPTALAVRKGAQAMPASVAPSQKVYEQLNNHYVNGYINDFATRYSGHLQQMISKGEPYFVMVEKVFKEHGIPEEMKYLAVIESGFNTNAISRVGAVGAWQFMSGTARIFGLNVGKKVDERRDFYKSTIAAAKYLNELHDQFDDWLLVVAAYNCGAGGVQRAQRMSGRSDFWGIQYFLPQESKNHVYKFIATGYILDRFNSFFGVDGDYKTAKAAAVPNNAAPAVAKADLTDEELYNTVVFSVSGKYRLEAIAKKLSMDIEELDRMNPGFDKVMASVDNAYDLRIPKDKMKAFQSEKEEILKESLQITLDDKATTADKSKFPPPVKRSEATAAKAPAKKYTGTKAKSSKAPVKKKSTAKKPAVKNTAAKG
ncbi:membrane-bound lytic murein transglycosylase D [Chitinophaga skermanii]|uniref:Membrane-bound lytic murein transglycosylase D n=1 Tax=Chitinophaga skermanii TaxID=331697 RepID=A0A327QLQ2_9BACT|nr:lytic transglycosylase domain-containing protein [Chitinophaga skermanii]RAJ04273.1 membrane-bound lytic murein transglycosylase D [Chitinophaga skermanii]